MVTHPRFAYHAKSSDRLLGLDRRLEHIHESERFESMVLEDPTSKAKDGCFLGDSRTLIRGT